MEKQKNKNKTKKEENINENKVEEDQVEDKNKKDKKKKSKKVKVEENEEEDEKKPIPEKIDNKFAWKLLEEPIPSQFQELKAEKWIKIFQSQVSENYKDIISNDLRQVIYQSKTLENYDLTDQYVNFLNWNRNVKKIKELWKDSLTGGEFKGCSYKVGRKKKRGNNGGDDIIYRDNPILQELVPRGLCFMKMKDNNIKRLVLFSNRKFFGRRNGDDDDSDLCSTIFRDGKFERFLISKKANGESCQIALLPDKETWIIGSKNRKLLAKEREHIAQYEKDKMYSFALEMANHFFDVLESKSPELRAELKEFLDLTKMTLNFEFESPQHQHLEPIYEKKLVFISFTGIHVPGMCLHPIFVKAFGDYFSIPHVLTDSTEYPKDQAETQCETICRQWGKEGSVLILLDANRRVIDFVKVKTFWYIYLRAIREKLKNMKSTSQFLQICKTIIERLKLLEGKMKIPSNYTELFIRLGTNFALWLCEDLNKRREQLAATYPICWIQFLHSLSLPLDASILQSKNLPTMPFEVNNSALPLLVMLQGIPGLGKSASAQLCVDLLNEKQIPSIQVAQDDFSGNNSGKLCLEHVKNLLIEKKHQVVILARNNASIDQYRKYLSLETDGLCKFLFIAPKEYQTRQEAFVYMCIVSVIYRKFSDDSHPTSQMELGDLASLPLKFCSEFKVHPSAIQMKTMFDEQKLSIPDENCLSHLIQTFKKEGFKGKSLTENDISSLKLNNPHFLKEYLHQSHLPLETVANNMASIIQRWANADIPFLGSYLRATITLNDSKILEDACQSFIKKDFLVYASHVTLVHSFDYFRNPDLWFKVYTQIGKPLYLSNFRLAVEPEKIVTLVVDLTDKDGNNMNSLIYSGYSHVTIATAPKVEPFYSIHLIKKMIESKQEFIQLKDLTLPIETIIELQQ